MQSMEPVIDLWQILGSLGSIILVVLTAYGTLILYNRNRVRTLEQRLLGAEGDMTDDGFLVKTMDRLDDLGDKMDQHGRQVNQDLRENRKRVQDIERSVERVKYKVDEIAQVVESEHSVVFRNRWDSKPDGGVPPENTRMETPPDRHRQTRRRNRDWGEDSEDSQPPEDDPDPERPRDHDWRDDQGDG